MLDEQHRELTPPEGRAASLGREQAWVASVRDTSHAIGVGGWGVGIGVVPTARPHPLFPTLLPTVPPTVAILLALRVIGASGINARARPRLPPRDLAKGRVRLVRGEGRGVSD